MSKKGRIVKVEIFTPEGRIERYFGSLKAIYTEFTEEQVGCSLSTLYHAHISTEKHYGNDRCLVRYVEVARVPHRDGARRRD